MFLIQSLKHGRPQDFFRGGQIHRRSQDFFWGLLFSCMHGASGDDDVDDDDDGKSLSPRRSHRCFDAFGIRSEAVGVGHQLACCF